MSFANLSAAKAYATIGLETGVPSAEPHQLICMLFEGALLSVAQAKQHLVAKNLPAKGLAVSRAVQIIEEGLKASLDLRAGGDLARNLWQLYEYMSRRLLLASLNSEVSGMDEVLRILGDLKEAWESIDPRSANAQNATVLPLPKTAVAASHSGAAAPSSRNRG
jgi:flagellar protein FliS